MKLFSPRLLRNNTVRPEINNNPQSLVEILELTL
jgi:hypothetical protein